MIKYCVSCFSCGDVEADIEYCLHSRQLERFLTRIKKEGWVQINSNEPGAPSKFYCEHCAKESYECKITKPS
jgi:hypothetical protein